MVSWFSKILEKSKPTKNLKLNSKLYEFFLMNCLEINISLNDISLRTCIGKENNKLFKLFSYNSHKIELHISNMK